MSWVLAIPRGEGRGWPWSRWSPWPGSPTPEKEATGSGCWVGMKTHVPLSKVLRLRKEALLPKHVLNVKKYAVG